MPMSTSREQEQREKQEKSAQQHWLDYESQIMHSNGTLQQNNCYADSNNVLARDTQEFAAAAASTRLDFVQYNQHCRQRQLYQQQQQQPNQQTIFEIFQNKNLKQQPQIQFIDTNNNSNNNCAVNNDKQLLAHYHNGVGGSNVDVGIRICDHGDGDGLHINGKAIMPFARAFQQQRHDINDALSEPMASSSSSNKMPGNLTTYWPGILNQRLNDIRSLNNKNNAADFHGFNALSSPDSAYMHSFESQETLEFQAENLLSNSSKLVLSDPEEFPTLTKNVPKKKKFKSRQKIFKQQQQNNNQDMKCKFFFETASSTAAMQQQEELYTDHEEDFVEETVKEEKEQMQQQPQQQLKQQVQITALKSDFNVSCDEQSLSSSSQQQQSISDNNNKKQRNFAYYATKNRHYNHEHYIPEKTLKFQPMQQQQQQTLPVQQQLLTVPQQLLPVKQQLLPAQQQLDPLLWQQQQQQPQIWRKSRSYYNKQNTRYSNNNNINNNNNNNSNPFETPYYQRPNGYYKNGGYYPHYSYHNSPQEQQPQIQQQHQLDYQQHPHEYQNNCTHSNPYRLQQPQQQQQPPPFIQNGRAIETNFAKKHQQQLQQQQPQHAVRFPHEQTMMKTLQQPLALPLPATLTSPQQIATEFAVQWNAQQRQMQQQPQLKELQANALLARQTPTLNLNYQKPKLQYADFFKGQFKSDINTKATEQHYETSLLTTIPTTSTMLATTTKSLNLPELFDSNKKIDDSEYMIKNSRQQQTAEQQQPPTTKSLSSAELLYYITQNNKKAFQNALQSYLPPMQHCKTTTTNCNQQQLQQPQQPQPHITPALNNNVNYTFSKPLMQQPQQISQQPPTIITTKQNYLSNLTPQCPQASKTQNEHQQREQQLKLPLKYQRTIINAKDVNTFPATYEKRQQEKQLQQVKIQQHPQQQQQQLLTTKKRTTLFCSSSATPPLTPKKKTTTPASSKQAQWPQLEYRPAENIVANIPKTMLRDQYGIAGLYAAIKRAETDQNIADMVFGIDLENLSPNCYNNKEKQAILPYFKGPFANENDLDIIDDIDSNNVDVENLLTNQQYTCYSSPTPSSNEAHAGSFTGTTNLDNNNSNEISLSSCHYGYPLCDFVRQALMPPNMFILSDEELFLIFYTKVGDLAQILSAQELYNREWVYYVMERMWIKHFHEFSYVQLDGHYERGYYMYFDAHNWCIFSRYMKIDLNHIDERPCISSSPPPPTSASSSLQQE